MTAVFFKYCMAPAGQILPRICQNTSTLQMSERQIFLKALHFLLCGVIMKMHYNIITNYGVQSAIDVSYIPIVRNVVVQDNQGTLLRAFPIQGTLLLFKEKGHA